MFFTKSLTRTAKWLCLAVSATAITLGSTAPTQAGVIPWVYNAIFGPARNGPMYGGGAMYGPSYGGGFSSYGPAMGGGCSTGTCGQSFGGMGYGAGYGMAPLNYGMSAGYGWSGDGCGSCGVQSMPMSGCATGNCGVSYYTPMASACTPNAGGSLTPVPAATGAAAPAGAGLGAGSGTPGGFTGNGFSGGATGAGAGTGAPTGNPMGGVNGYDGTPRTFAPADGGAGRTSPDTGFRGRGAGGSPALNEESGTGFRPVTPAPANPAAETTPAAAPAAPAGTGDKAAPAPLIPEDANLGPVSDADKHVASRSFRRMTVHRTLQDARLARGPVKAATPAGETITAQVAKR
jgi:hypothetical protein